MNTNARKALASGTKSTQEARVKAVREILLAANYHAGWEVQVGGIQGRLTCYVGSGRNPVILVQEYGGYSGVEVYTPLNTSSRLDVTLEALKTACTRYDQSIAYERPFGTEGPLLAVEKVLGSRNS